MDYWHWTFIILMLMNHEAVNYTTQWQCTGETKSLRFSRMLDTSDYTISWSVDGHEKPCLKNYKLSVCIEQACTHHIVNSIKHMSNSYTFEAKVTLEPCSHYQVTVTALYWNSMRSSPFSLTTPFTTYNQAPGVVGDISVTEVTRNSLTVMWSEPTSAPRCTQGYYLVLSRDNEFKQQILQSIVRNNKTYTFAGLNPCTLYYISVEALTGNHPIEIRSTFTYTSVTTPGVVGDIRVTKVTPNSLTVMWSEPTSAPRCTQEYELVLSRDNEFKQQILQSIVRNNKTYTFAGLNPCTLYYISVKALSSKYSTEIRSTFSYTSVISNATVNNLTIEHATEDRITISWAHIEPWFGCISMFKVYVKLAGTVHRTISSWNTSAEIDNLEPCTTYDISVTVLFWGGVPSQQSASINASILSGVPSQPKNVRVTAISSSKVQVQWAPPDKDCGILNNYIVVLQNRTLRYKVAPGCQLPTLKPLQVVVNGTTTTAVITELPADMEFQVTVAAATKKGGPGRPSAPVTSATLTGVSEPVRNLSVTVTQNFTKLWWLHPCNTAGSLTHFLIQFNGSTNLFHNLQHDDLNKGYSDIYKNSLLKAESSYNVTIIPIGNNGTYGQHKSEIFTVPPRTEDTEIPAERDEEKFMSLPRVESSSQSAVVTIYRDTFPNTEGTVQFFAILVAESFPKAPSHGWQTNGTQSTLSTWAKARQSRPILPYQTRPPWPNPFQSSPLEELEVDVGSQKCSETEYATYCDGPLESGTAYELRIRAFTATKYRDSESIKFHTEYPTSGFATVVILIILAIAITSVVSFILWRKWSEEGKKTIIKKEPKVKKTNTSDFCEGLTIEQFLHHSENVLSSQGLIKTEFNILENENHQYPQIAAKLEHNKEKNRYANICPYDKTRVILEGDDDKHDYINASHVKLQEARSVNYLACQAPKAATCGDFWKMIFQFRVNIIVMLCMPVEKEKEKCFIYYPCPTEVVMYDNIVIYCRTEERFSNYIVRRFVVDKGGVTLKVKQFHFIGWPDFGVPESPDVMMKFVEAVEHVSNGKELYMAVHCSAGVGRTGTFIALDALMRLIRQKWNCTFNVLDIVHKMRQQRCKMVQTEDQYKYIYECMKYALESHRSPFIKVRMYLYKRSKKARRSGGSDSNELLQLEDLSPQTPVTT